MLYMNNHNKYVYIYYYIYSTCACTCICLHIYICKHAFIDDIHLCIHSFMYVYIQVFHNIHRCIYIFIFTYMYSIVFYMHTYVICSKSSRILQVSCAEVFGTFEGLLKLRLARGIWKTRVSFIYLHHTLAINFGRFSIPQQRIFQCRHSVPSDHQRQSLETWYTSEK